MMKRNPHYRVSGLKGQRQSDDMVEILSYFVADAMQEIESTLGIWTDEDEGEAAMFRCVVKPVTTTTIKRLNKQGKARSHSEGIQAFASIMCSDESAYAAAYVAAEPVREGLSPKTFFESRASQSSSQEAARDAMAKAAAVAIEEGVVYLEASVGSRSYLWEVWVSSLGKSPKAHGLTYSYGVLPDAVAFDQQFEEEIGDGKVYKIENKGGLGGIIPRGKTEWTAPSLWRLLVEMTATDEDDEVFVVSDILGTLGIEWV